MKTVETKPTSPESVTYAYIEAVTGISVSEEDRTPRELFFDRYGRQLSALGDGNFLNPDWLKDKRHPIACNGNAVKLQRFETSCEVMVRNLTKVVSGVRNMQRRAALDAVVSPSPEESSTADYE